jgi:O-methyltransferase involved in polyketide biosynthesis
MNTTNDQIELESVQETLLLPLWGRAVESKKQKPKLIDPKAVEIINSINYDFTIIGKNVNKLSMASWIARSIYFDQKIKQFIKMNEDATIVNIGCGLDTTYDRIDNGKIQWIDLDLPDVINLRRKYIKETERRLFIADSILNDEWCKQIKNKKHTMFMIAGVLYYFTKEEVTTIFYNFKKQVPGVEVLFDYSSPKGIEVANKKVIDKGGMSKASYLKWGIEDIHELERNNEDIKVLDDMKMFEEYKKLFPFYKRIGMNISDALKIMSLTHIRIS